MGCGCHTTNGTGDIATEIKDVPGLTFGKIRPLDQCIACTQKHISEAYCAWNEFKYDAENRMFVIGQLQLAIHHSCREWKALAEKIRDLCHLIQQGRESKERWLDVLDDACNEYYKAHPEVLKRIEEKALAQKEAL